MNTLKLLFVAMSVLGMGGCISLGSDTPGPEGPPGPPGATERVIVVPEKTDDKKVIVVPK